MVALLFATMFVASFLVCGLEKIKININPLIPIISGFAALIILAIVLILKEYEI